MRKYIIILFIALLPFMSKAQTTYHVASDGTGDFSTISQVNAHSFYAGDQILFKRGDIFSGTITVSNNGTNGNKITYGAYGTGNKPIITSLADVTSWTNLGSNIWESANSVSSATSLNMVVINGVNTPAGRYPNTTFLTYQSHSGTTSLTSSSLNSSSTNWTGADVFIRLNEFEQMKREILSHSGGTITFTANEDAWPPQDGFGFYITDDPRTLDVQNEWYYNPSTGKIRVYSTSMPTGVQVPTEDYLFNCSKENITVENLSFIGANENAVNLITCPGVLVQNLDVNYAGDVGIYLDWTDNGLIQNNSVKNCNDIGIMVASGWVATTTGNIIDSIGINWNKNGCGIIMNADYHTVTYNTISNVGRYGIQDANGYGLIQYNYINTFCLKANDAGAIYANGSRPGQRIIDHNIILNGVGDQSGQAEGIDEGIQGIYLDAHPTKIVVTNNTLYNVPTGGIKVHMAADCRVENNTSYDCGRGITFEDYEGNYVRRDTIRNNIAFAKKPNQLALYWYTVNNDISDAGIFENNTYVKPVNPSQLIQTREPSTSYVYRNLSNWQSYREPTAKTLSDWTDTSKIILVYNNSSGSLDKSISGTFKNAAGTSFTSSITLSPFESALLYQTAAGAAPPSISMSGSQNITATSTTLYATPMWASGRTGTILWTKISGAGATTFSAPTSFSTQVSGLQNGDYVFRCTATQDDGQTTYGEISVHVEINEEPPQPPNAYIKLRYPYKLIQK